MLFPIELVRTHGGTRWWIAIGAVAGVAWLLGLLVRPERVQVVGDSMLPTLCSGDRAIAVRSWWLRAGELVVLADSRAGGRTMVKRASWIGRDTARRRVAWVEGDNPAASTDSRALGLIPRSDVSCRLVWRYAPPERSGGLGWWRNATPRRPVLSHLAPWSARYWRRWRHERLRPAALYRLGARGGGV